MPMITNGNLPGEIHDARINLYLLEHFYQNLIGLKHSFTDADFLYPFPKTALLTDNYWGTAFIYSFFRWINLDTQTSFCGWFLIGFIVNYAASYIVSRKLELNELSATMAAFIFTFSLPIISQSIHAQLLYRPYVPIAIFAAIKYLDSQKLHYLALSALMVSLQFITAGYNGMFLAIFIAILMICEVFRTKSIKNILPSKDVHQSTYLFLLGTTIILTIYATPYFVVKAIYNLQHLWEVTSLMIPRILSYFRADLSYLWISKDLNIFKHISYPYEHQLFVGIGALIAILTLFFNKKRLNNLTATRFANATLITMVFFVIIGSFTLYSIIFTAIPGVSQIRAPGRMILILLFPIGYLVGLAIENLEKIQIKHIPAKTISFILCALIIGDSITMDHPSTTKSSWNSRLTNITSKMPKNFTKDSVLVLKSESGFCSLSDVDAMMVSQELGIKTINGCSSSVPGERFVLTTCANVEKRIKNSEELLTKITQQKYQFDRSKLIYIGFAENCSYTKKIQDLKS